MKRGRSVPSTTAEAFFAGGSDRKYGKFVKTLSDGRRLHEFGALPPMNKQSWAQQAFAGPFSPAMYGAMKRGAKPRASYVPYEKYGRRRTYAKRTASYPRKRAYASRPKYRGKKGSRFYYSKYKPRSYFVQGSRANIKRMGKTWRAATKTQRTNRKRLGYYGRGSYTGALSRFADRAYKRAPAVFSTGSKVLHGAAVLAQGTDLAPPLEFASRGLGVASTYMGRGAYKSNGLITGGADTMPRMQHINDETGSLMVSHRERLMDVFAPADSGFHQDVFTVSPGIEKTFPWLSQIAANYEEYELMQCVFEYDGHSLVGINDTLEVQGSLIMATQMNVKDKPFRDRHEMERFPHASKCAQHGSMAHGVECDPRKIQGDGHRYIRMGGMPWIPLLTIVLRQISVASKMRAKKSGNAAASAEADVLYKSTFIAIVSPYLAYAPVPGAW